MAGNMIPTDASEQKLAVLRFQTWRQRLLHKCQYTHQRHPSRMLSKLACQMFLSKI